MRTQTITLSADNEIPIPTMAAGQSVRRLWFPLSLIAVLPWLTLAAESIRGLFNRIRDIGRIILVRLLTTFILLNIPSVYPLKHSINFLKTAEDAAILNELGLKGRWTFFWVKMVVFSLTLTTLSIEMLQISQFSGGSVSTLLLLLAIITAFNSLVTSIVYCWYSYNTRLANDLNAWKQLVTAIGDNAMSIMISLPLAYFLWAVFLLCLSFATSYACPPVVCVRFSDASPRIALIGPPLLAMLVVVCYVLHACTVAYILRRYHACLDQPQSEELPPLNA